MTPPAPALLDAALRGVLVALLGVLVVAIAATSRRRLSYRVTGLALATGLALQTIANAPAIEAAVSLEARSPWIGISVGNAVLFWLFVRSLVDDDFHLARRHAAVWLAVVLSTTLNCAFVLRSGHRIAPIAGEVQRTLPLAFALLTAAAAIRHWSADLVENRRRLRAFVVVAGCGYALVAVVARRVASDGRLSGGASTLDVALLLAIVAVVAGRTLRLAVVDPFDMAPREAVERPSAAAADVVPVDPPARPDAVDAVDPVDERLAQALHRAMRDDRLYRSEDLTVAGLAARLGAPEYRLRRVINQRLGHRNFNAFVNGLRLDDAKAALADPARRDLPILTVALDAGFQSIGPFNRAFKADTGLTPGDWRRRKLAES